MKKSNYEKKNMLILISLTCYFSGINAQTYYYNETKTFYENGYTYQCDKKEWGRVLLYNKSNKYTYADWTYKNGSPISQEIFEGEVDLIEDDDWTKLLCNSIVNNAFPNAEKQRVKGLKITVTMTLDSNTGKVIEVDFGFFPNEGLGTIPISIYRKIETELKSNVWFILTSIGKQLNFVQRGWVHEIK